MKFKLLFFFPLLSIGISYAQYKNDNVLYRTVYAAGLCDSLNKYPDKLILDVRSASEYNEEQVKGSRGMDLGHFKNAVNIDIQQLGTRISEINDYKDRPVFVVCSHSQRSRRASTLLAQNGFTHVININGGLTTLHQQSYLDNECFYDKLETRMKYQLIAPTELCKLVHDPNLYLLDVRPDAAYTGSSKSEAANSLGIIKGSKHIQTDDIAARINEIPRDRKVVIIDGTGDDVSVAANLLVQNNYKNISVLAGGVEQYLVTDSKVLPCRNALYETSVNFKVIGAMDVAQMLTSDNRPVFIDTRNYEEFSNKSKDGYKNIGNIKGAINMPVNLINDKINDLSAFKNSPIVIYNFSTSDDNYRAAKLLVSQGFKDVYVLSRGLFNLRWTAHNMEGYQALNDIVVNVPAENL